MRVAERILIMILFQYLLVLSGAGLSITELMSDPDSWSDYDLEWVELYNNSSEPLVMEDWTLNGKPFSMTLEPYSAGILARKLTGEKDTFESVYGDGSGVWGDTPEEDYPCVEASLSLLNGGGTLVIQNDRGEVVLQRDYPSDEGDVDDNTLLLYSEGFWDYGEIPGGTPGEAELMISYYFSDNALKEGGLYRNDEILLTETCADSWLVSPVKAGEDYRAEIRYNGEIVFEDFFSLWDDYRANVELNLPPPFDVTFSFKNTTGELFPSAYMRVEREDAVFFDGETASGEALSLYPGRYEIYAAQEGCLGRYETVSIEGHEEICIVFPPPDRLIISEFAPYGTVEWVELRNLYQSPVTTKGLFLSDDSTQVSLEESVVDSYSVFTKDKELFCDLWGEGLPVIEIRSFPILNDTGDSLSLHNQEEVFDALEYDSSWHKGERPGSYERIMPEEAFQPGNVWPSEEPTPGCENRVEGMMSASRLLLLKEVSPFTPEDYVRCLVADDGTEGRGCLFIDYEVTDLDTAVSLEERIYQEGETVMVTGLTLGKRGDQACIMSREGLMDAFAWRKRYIDVGAAEDEDYRFLQENGVDPMLFDDSDPTMSFHQRNGEWIIASASSDIDTEESSWVLFLPAVFPADQGEILLHYSFDVMTELKLTLFDVGGFCQRKHEAVVSGDGVLSLSHSLPQGRYLCVISLRRGEKKRETHETLVLY